MKKILYLKTTVLMSAAVLFLSSCLKDSRYVDFSKGPSTVEFPLGGRINFASDAVTDPGDTITKKFAINLASVTVPTTATTVTLSVNDPALTTAYNASDPSVSYLPMPAAAYVFTQTSVTVPAGSRTAILSVTFYKHLLDPSLSYMLPIAIKSAPGFTVSGNKGVHYYHFIGNDFAGSYKQDFRRYNGPDSNRALSGASFNGQPVVISPVTPSQFEVASGYAGGAFRYEVTFTKTGNGAGAMYSNFAVFINADDIKNNLPGLTITQPAVFLVGSFYDPNKSYTYADALKLFRFQYQAHSSADRYLVDKYYK